MKNLVNIPQIEMRIECLGNGEGNKATLPSDEENENHQ